MKGSGACSPGRRTEAIPKRDWDPVPWENDLPFRVLSTVKMVGEGGIKALGLIEANVVA